jgi:3-deoxy-manno-octulosonate cytidylyltransferase (CMP-KDO synthetase)
MTANPGLDFWAIIPARRASTRLPNKPLLDIAGKPMVVRVAERAAASGASRVVVATDDAEIHATVEAHGFTAMMTRHDHPSGTDRIAEVVAALHATPDQIVVNVQGDEPMIEPELIAGVAQTLHSHRTCAVATAAAPIEDLASLQSPHVVKVVFNANHQALYFSRAPIPYHRDAWPDLQHLTVSAPGSTQGQLQQPHLRHLGIYSFRAAELAAFVTWPACPLEQTEQLEQLRWLWKGRSIAVHMLQRTPSPGVDTAEDLERVRSAWHAEGSL